MRASNVGRAGGGLPEASALELRAGILFLLIVYALLALPPIHTLMWMGRSPQTHLHHAKGPITSWI
jgi:hypothetical protein